jgi:regulatory protein
MVSRKSKTSSPGSGSDALARGDEARLKGADRAAKAAKRKPPLDEAGLRDLALFYVARFATTGARVEAYLVRKIRERGLAEDSEGRSCAPDVTGIVTRLIELGYIDDAAYARAKARDLTQRGYGARRVEQALWAAGVEQDLREGSAPGEAASRRAAMLLAKKRGLGPFARGPRPDPDDRAAVHKRREKQVAAMLRAGHLFEHIQFILDAAEADAIEDWVIEAENEEDAHDGLA